MTIGDLWLGNSRSKIKDDASDLEKVTCNLFLGRNITNYLKFRYPLLNVTVLDLVSQVRNVVLMNVYLDLGNSGGSGFWNGGYMSQVREMRS